MTTSINAGQGELEGIIPEASPIEPMDPDRVLAISSFILYKSQLRGLRPSDTSQPDYADLNPEVIRGALYVPEGVESTAIPDARDGVVFPSWQFGDITISPQRVASEAGRRVRSKRRTDADQDFVAQLADESSAEALENLLGRAVNLETALTEEEAFFKTVLRELRGAKGTGYYAHFKYVDLMIKMASAETALEDALTVAAQRYGWDRETLKHKKQALQYQLYGPDPNPRVRNWRGYSHMGAMYARDRKLRVRGSQTRIRDRQRKLARERTFK
jgi:hypothetical protein